MKRHIFGAIALTLISTSTFAQQTGPNPFKDCGIGAALFADTPWAAVTSNVIWDVGTTAVISATASPDTCSGSGYKTALFINETYESLEQDLIQGEGEFINTLAEIMSCNADTANQMAIEVRQIIATTDLANDQTRLKKAEGLYLNVISTDAAQSCATQS
jgi:hypothetical protein